jgi:hypothetical protein
MVEFFTRDGNDTEVAGGYFFDKTGMMQDICYHGTHFLIDERLTLEILKEISDSDDVIEVTGE